jgi:Dockerin type I domain
MVTDASGFFTVTVTALPTGMYNWRVKSTQPLPTPTDNNPGWLAVSGTLTLAGAPVTQQEMGLQLSGDVDNNNVVASIDFTLLKNAFGKSLGQPGYDNRADIDGSQVIGAVDFTALKANFGLGGADPIRPQSLKGRHRPPGSLLSLAGALARFT